MRGLNKFLILLSCGLLVVVAVSGCTIKGMASQNKKVPTKLVLKANGPAARVPLEAEEGVEPREVSLKAEIHNGMITIVTTYKDSTPVKIGDIWEFDGTKWTKSSFDDTLILLWNINDSIIGFNKKGFDVMTTGLSKGKDYMDFTIEGENPPRGRWEGYKQKGDFWMY